MAKADWAAIGLTGNPFINVTPGEHLEWVELPPGLEAALAQRPAIIELVGAQKGSGKSTALHAVAAQTAGARLHYAAQPLPLVDLKDVTLFALDEANLWPARALTALGKHARATGMSLLFGTHHSLSFPVPNLHSLHLDRLPTFGWLERRVRSATLSEATPFDFVGLAQELSPRFGHVKYAVLRVLYELAEDLARGEPFSPALVDRSIARATTDDTVRLVAARP